MYNAKLKDYSGSGYDKGHMVPALDSKRSLRAYKETFYLTNTCPQVGKGFNQGYWQELERFTRGLTEKYEEIYVQTGSLYLPKKVDGKWIVQFEMIGDPPNISVPTHFYKCILALNNGAPTTLGIFVLPNQSILKSTPLSNFKSSFNFVEGFSGYSIFERLGNDKENLNNLCDHVNCKF